MDDHEDITRDELAAALAVWETEAKKQGWPDRDDPERHTDNADYLISTIRQARLENTDG